MCFAYDLPNSVPRRCIEQALYPVIYAAHDSEPYHLAGLKEGCDAYFSNDDDDIKYVLKNAVAIIYKGQELDWFKDNYKVCDNTMRFDCYVMDNFIQKDSAKISEKDGEIHVVQGGGVFSMKANPILACASQYLHIAPYFTDKNIHYHLYPASLCADNDYEEYFQYEKNNPYFHFHEPLGYRDFLKEITKYDFAVPIHETRYRWDRPFLFDTILPSKIFGFIEAGIPIISNLQAMGHFAEKNGIGKFVPFAEIDNIDVILRSINMKDMKDNIVKVRQKLNMDNYINKMVNYCSKVRKDWEKNR